MTVITDHIVEDHVLEASFATNVAEIFHLSKLLPSRHFQEDADFLLSYFVKSRRAKLVDIQGTMNGCRFSQR